MVRPLALLLLAALPCLPALAASPLCATPEQAAKVREAYASPPAAAPFMAAGKLGVPEGVLLSALDSKSATGTGGAAFQQVWQSLQAWPDSTSIVVKGGNVVEIRGRIPPGTPSTKSQYYNLKQEGAGLAGHLRPDLMGAIYAVELAGAEGSLRGITFVDQSGESLFGVYLPEGAGDKPEFVAGFEKTREIIKGLPRVCP
ncbi:MAG: hypothetical protein J0M16_02280 [Gammaproteobacteria bacterium]|nr:hypothetical protein [Gammaproteobacteria bacterium]